MKDWSGFLVLETILLGLAVVSYYVPFFGYGVCVLLGLTGSGSLNTPCESYLGSVVFITFGVLLLLGHLQRIRVSRKR